MSVVSSIAGFRHRAAKCLFSPEMLPKRLHDNGKIPGASGPNSLHVFCIGQAPSNLLCLQRIRDWSPTKTNTARCTGPHHAL